MSQSVFGRQHKLLRLMSGRLPTKPLPSAAKESTNDVPEVVSVKNLPENGASPSNLLHVQEGRMIFGAAESRVNSPSAQRKRHRARERNPDVSYSSNSHRKSKSTGEISYSSPDPASAPLALHVDVLLHAHTRTCARIHTLGSKSRRHPFPHIGVRKTASK